MTCPYCNGRRKPCEMCAGKRQIVGPAPNAHEQARCETIGQIVGPPPQRTLDRDERAVRLAEARWPGRYVGDLTTAEWAAVYREVDHAAAAPSGTVTP